MVEDHFEFQTTNDVKRTSLATDGAEDHAWPYCDSDGQWSLPFIWGKEAACRQGGGDIVENDFFDELNHQGASRSERRSDTQKVAVEDRATDEGDRGPSTSIFSMSDLVEALKVSGAATCVMGWEVALAYARRQDDLNPIDHASHDPLHGQTSQTGKCPSKTNDALAGVSILHIGATETLEHADANVLEETAADLKQGHVHVTPSAAGSDRHDEWSPPSEPECFKPSIILDMDDAPGNEAPRLKQLLALYEARRAARRPLLLGDDAMIDRLNAVDAIAPSFATATGLVRRAAHLSRITGKGMIVPHILLSGPPGVGKSFYCDKIAHAIGTTMTKIAVGAVSALTFLGHEPSWKTPSIGFVTKALLACQTSSPVLLLDELEKAATGYESAPLDPLLSLCERENARALADNFLGIRFNYSHVIFFASVNDPDALSAPLRDRFLHMPIARPTHAQTLLIVRNMLRSRFEDYGGIITWPNEAVIVELAKHHPRRASQIIDLALGFMAEAGRTALSVADVIGAEALIEPDSCSPSPMGFLPIRAGKVD